MSTARTVEIPQMATLLKLLGQYTATRRGHVILTLSGVKVHVLLVEVRSRIFGEPTGETELRCYLEHHEGHISPRWVGNVATLLGMQYSQKPRAIDRRSNVYFLRGTLPH